jgi:hypothetical protein
MTNVVTNQGPGSNKGSVTDSDEPAERYQAVGGDFIISAPNEIHALRAGPQGCVFMAFAEGPRGGEEYESDTFRVDSIIPADE